MVWVMGLSDGLGDGWRGWVMGLGDGWRGWLMGLGDGVG